MAKAILFVLSFVPCVILFYQAGVGSLGPDPGKELVLETGEWALRFLILTLAISPLASSLRSLRLHRFRRMLGLYSWFYASVHFGLVLTFILGWSWAVFLEEFFERPYMSVGILAWTLMVLLGLSSNRWAMRRLGAYWKSLHRWVYAIAILACVHIIWLVRSDYAEALVYTVLVMVLLLARVSGLKLWSRAPKKAG